MGLIAMVANTLFEKTGDLQQKAADYENELLGMETEKQSLHNQLQEATSKYDEKLTLYSFICCYICNLRR